MVSALIVGLAWISQAQGTTANLFRGSSHEGGYWAVADTYIDSAESDKPKGGLFTLLGGKGRTILIRFGDLDHAIPPNAKITKATLFLSPSSNDTPTLASIAVLRSPWGEGPMFTTVPASPEAPATQWAATWKQRRNGRNGVDWQQPGATGPEDATVIAGAKLDVADKEVAITGLEGAVLAMRDRWFENHGFALTFSSACEFFSSQAKNGRPRLVIEYTAGSSASGPDLSVQWIDRVPQNPKNGEDVTYRAAVKNVGDAATSDFEAQWVTNERKGGRFQVKKALSPGEEIVLESKGIYRRTNDPRTSSVELRLYPTTPEPNSANDAVSIFEEAIPVAVSGAKVAADGLQAEIRRIHETYFEQSRFSFATDGVLERVRWVPAQDGAQYVIDLTGGPKPGFLINLISTLTGINGNQRSQSVKLGDREIAIGDPYPGISGFGDTRYEGLIPAGIPMLYAPVASPLFDNLPIEANGLLSATEVAAINLAIGQKGKSRQSILWDLPSTIILRATDMTGKPLDGAELAFYQLDRGVIPEAPTQTILTKEGGTVILDNREVEAGIIDKDALHQLNKNPFGNIRADGSNGTILIKALINGETEFGWLKAWQLVDAYHRGNKAAAIIDVRFNAPSGPLDRTTNLAKGRLVTDKGGTLPATLNKLVDEDPATEVSVGPEIGDWIEIDLGRDRPIGEVRVLLKDSAMPAKLDIQAYSTGQAATEVGAWVKDLDFRWTLANRGVPESGGIAIPYRGPLTRSRYIRIINRSGGTGKIADVRIIPLKSQ